MQIDEQGLGELLEESKDIHADAMRDSDKLLDEFVETGLEQRAHGEIDPDEGRDFAENRSELLKRSLVGVGAAAGIGAAMLALSETASFAATATDVQILQTNQSIENLAIATYTLALTLPFIGGSTANGVVKAFVTETLAQHKQHDAAFGSAIRKLGGKMQPKADPVLLKVVNKAKPTLTGPGPVVALALELEDGTTQTYVAATGALRNSNARKVTASIMGVEAQHAAILRAVQALLNANDASLIALPPSPLTSLPAAAGSVGFPHAFYPTSGARPET
ncbi:MAG: ferritin-like domain-containing protein, partial [Vulcanimicrobiaceae bacterium]